MPVVPAFLAPGTSFMADNFPLDWRAEGLGGWFHDDSGALHLVCALFLLLLHQFHLRSSGTGSQRLGTPDVQPSTKITESNRTNLS